MKNSNNNTIGFRFNYERTAIKLLLTCILVFGLLPAAFSQNLDSLKVNIKPQITLSSAFNDNVYLVNSQDENFKDDIVFHVMPKFGIRRQHNKHTYGLFLDSDFRKGIQTAPFGSNVQTNGEIQLNYNNGLQISLQDSYMYSDFDLGLTDLPGITKRQMNNFRSQVSYTLVEKLKVYGSYDNRWFTFTNEPSLFERFSNVYGAGTSYNFSKRLFLEADYKHTDEKFAESQDSPNRTINDFNGKFAFPLSLAFGSYLSYRFNRQYSEELTDRNYNNNRYVAGITWQGRNRLKAWAEAGYEQIVFTSTSGNSYNNFIGMAGFDMKISEVITAMLSAGVDGFSNLIFDGEINYNYSKKTSVNLSAKRSSQVNFLNPSDNDFFIFYNYRLQFQTTINEITLLKLGGSFQTRDNFSDNIDLPTAGTIFNIYRVYSEINIKPTEKLTINLDVGLSAQDTNSETDNNNDFNTWDGKISFDYSLKKWLRAGVNYRYAERNASLDLFDFDNTRYGLFVTFTL